MGPAGEPMRPLEGGSTAAGATSFGRESLGLAGDSMGPTETLTLPPDWLRGRFLNRSKCERDEFWYVEVGCALWTG